jgi:MFS family permease
MTSFASEPPPGQPSAAASQRSRNLALAILALTGLMLVLDITITNVALPTIQRALGTTTQDLLAGTGSSPDPATIQAALTGGYAAALRGAALVALAGAALSMLLLPSSQPAPSPNLDTTTPRSGRPA